ncbi:MAG: FtsX-like permease family protein [Clostridia bacterium]|nr:FtsX-like permease family protein [Clostridia bacterium]
MLLTVLRRFSGNRWKTLSMLTGLILALAMAFGVPMYSEAILQQMLNKTFEDRFEETEKYPAYLSMKSEQPAKLKDALGIKQSLGESFEKTVEEIGLPVKESCVYTRYSMLFRDVPGSLTGKKSLTFYEIEGLQDHVSVISGRMFDPERDDGVIEVVAMQTALVNSDLMLGQIYEAKSSANKNVVFRFEVVGLVNVIDGDSIFWYNSPENFASNLLFDDSRLEEMMREDDEATRHLTQYHWFAALDYSGVNMDGIDEVLAAYTAGEEESTELAGKKIMTFNAVKVFEELEEKSSALYVTMYSLLVPMFVVIAFYVIMIAAMKLESEQNEISVMQSRGAGRGHILSIYLVESIILIGIAAVAGPFLGWGLCRVIGASNGFLSFVNRKPLQLALVPESFVFLGVGAVLFMLITMIPAFMLAGVNIVESKNKKRAVKIPFYHKYFLDIALLLVGIYGWYTLRLRMIMPDATAEFTLENTDIMMFVAGTVFALGAGMFFLRIYPYLLRLVFAVGKRFWPAWAYYTLNRVSRSRECAAIMLFIILTISGGTVSADMARSVNRYIEKNIEVEVGADAVYMPRWKKYDENGNPVTGMISGNVLEIWDGDILVQSLQVSYPELLPSAFDGIEEIEHIARVYREEDITVKKERGQMQNVDVMLTDPYDFAQTANWPADLGYYHINEYANALTKVPYGCIISTKMMEDQKIDVGDKLTLVVGAGEMECTVVGAAEAWPGIEKYRADGDGNPIPNYFIIARLGDYIATNEMRPYQFFIKKADGVTDMELYDALLASDSALYDLESTDELLTAAKNEPVLQGTNGMLTVSFIFSVALCAAGFTVYWVIAIRKRQLQFGISRALGVSRAGVMMMLALEQVLVSGAAVFAGIFIGRIQSVLFVPFLSVNYTEPFEIIGFRVVTSVGDLVRILGVLGAVLAVCLAVLFAIVIRLKVDRALKLGED